MAILDQEQVDQQIALLQTHRRTLAHYLEQRAKLGIAFEPPVISHGIMEARQDIRRIKAILRGRNIQIEDLPDDEFATSTSDNPIAPAADGETLIIVAGFAGRASGSDIHPEWYVRNALDRHIAVLRQAGQRVRLEEWADPIKTQRAARDIGGAHGATLVLWGRFDRTAGIQTYVEIMCDVPQADIQLAGNWLPLGGLPAGELVARPISREMLLQSLPAQAEYLADVALGMVSLVQRNPDQAESLFSHALEAAQPALRHGIEVYVGYYWRGVARMLQERYIEARDDLAQALRLKPDFPLALAQSGVVALAIGDVIAAETFFRQAQRALSRSDRVGHTILLGNIGQTLELQGKFDEAFHYYELARQLVQQGVDPLTHAQTLIYYGGLLRRLGQPERALQCYDDALSLCRQIRFGQAEVLVLTHIGLLHYADSSIALALDYFGKALEQAQSLGSIASQAQLLLHLGVICLDLEDTEKAHALIQQARAFFEVVGSFSGQGRAYSCVALVEEQRGNRAGVITALERACALFRHVHSPDAATVCGELQRLRRL